jgi:hypothetical protein
VTAEGNVLNITTTQDETKRVTVSSRPNMINVTKETSVHNIFYNTSNTFYTEKPVNTSEYINATVLEHTTRLDDTIIITNARNTSERNMTGPNYNMDNSILNTFITLNMTMNKVSNPENNTFLLFPTSRQNETDNSNIRYHNTTNYNRLTSTGSTYNITVYDNHLDSNYVNSNTQKNNNIIDTNTASENIQ